MLAAGSSLIAAETILALTPVVIKKSPLDPTSAVWSRTLSSAVIGWFLTSERTLGPSEYAGGAALGFANLLHITSSYESFRNLPAGQATALLYTYPLWNLVFNQLVNGDVISVRDWLLMSVAGIGSVMLNLDPGLAAPTALGGTIKPAWGVFMGLVMAITESGMYTILRHLGWRDPAKSVYVVNAAASGWLGAVLGIQKLFFSDGAPIIGLQSGTWFDALWLTAFHSLSMFGGYWLRFFATPRLPTVTYSILSYAGLLASYLFGLFFLKERPGWLSITGAALILAAGVLLQTHLFAKE
jgi:drug/metabolite transporter (DMT)-like permease